MQGSGQILGFDWLSKTFQSFTNVVLRIATFWPMQGSGQILGFDWLSKTFQSFTNVVLRIAIFWPMQGRARFWDLIGCQKHFNPLLMY